MLLYILGLQLGHISGNKPTPVSTLKVVLVKTKTLHQFIKYVRCTYRVEPCAKTQYDRKKWNCMENRPIYMFLKQLHIRWVGLFAIYLSYVGPLRNHNQVLRDR